MTDSTDLLFSGYRRFREGHWAEAKAEYEALAAEGQTPHTLVIACSDSRADPALIFDAAPGQLFTVRNVANLAPPYAPDGDLHGVSAALEFGVKVLQVRRIVVMGHAHCGGVAAMRGGAPANCRDFLAPWIAQGEPTVRRVAEAVEPDEVEQASEEAVVRLSLDNLRTFPWIAEREAAGELELVGLHFGIADGLLRRLTGAGPFQPLA
ncbi:MAG: carbonic anhydrase [Alphaproteobacteria bacterium]|nr:carbonic anhydrase [Alphaproteobacteria bacterium]MBU1527109.1 carbonic anhydrase [Alphaproteobacteria bacterium]MBU2116065.1 carbonic anhydrase [Alphaproteobacteria bacterium]MBU2350695.1 carbonic anhydrase [Alphaproteobacteria bacterium]MBU2383312.1 carbonic anhydrase [Alphaproteobacteria bacterium]